MDVEGRSYRSSAAKAGCGSAASSGSSVRGMVDIDAAVGFVVARGDAVDRARLSWLRTGTPPAAEIFAARGEGTDARRRLARPGRRRCGIRRRHLLPARRTRRPRGPEPAAAVRALDWLAARQRLDGCWEEDAALAARRRRGHGPGDPEARFYLTANAGVLAGCRRQRTPTRQRARSRTRFS